MSTDGPADGRGVLGAKAGATYVSIFAGRVADEGGDAPGLVRAVREWLDLWGSPAKDLRRGQRPPGVGRRAALAPAAREWLDLGGSPAKIIVGSIRSSVDVQSAAQACAHEGADATDDDLR